MKHRVIVVDTSVARACGIGSPPAPQCMEALDALLLRASQKGDLRVGLSNELRIEWNRHASNFAVRWLSTMIAKKLHKVCSTPWEGERRLIDTAAHRLTPTKFKAVLKDTHIVCMAMGSSQRVISLDVAQRRLLSELKDDLPALTRLHWAVPTLHPTPQWLGNGAPDDPQIRLG
jgi:hypothetical protein